MSDVLRATPTIAQALAGGYRRVLCYGEVEDIAWRSRESVLDVAPRFARMVGGAAEVVSEG